MSFQELAKSRFSCRKYKDKKVDKETLVKVLETARIAPSAKNNQPWQFIVIQKKENLVKLHECYKGEWLKTAPAIIAVCGDHSEAWRRPDGKIHTDIDVAIAIDHLTLAATDAGLATCWICKFDVMKCVEILNLPEDMEPIALIPIGYPDEEPDVNRHKDTRKPLDEIVHWERFFFKYFKK